MPHVRPFGGEREFRSPVIAIPPGILRSAAEVPCRFQLTLQLGFRYAHLPELEGGRVPQSAKEFKELTGKNHREGHREQRIAYLLRFRSVFSVGSAFAASSSAPGIERSRRNSIC
jgi:hypothetical protein